MMSTERSTVSRWLAFADQLRERAARQQGHDKIGAVDAAILELAMS